MRFSIILPAYNAADRIIKTLESIKQQTFTDYELIAICDSCHDNTEEICKSYGAITEAVEFHGAGLSRNRALEIAKGDWILFMDDDDWYLHEYVLEQLDKKLTQNPDIDVLICSFIIKGLQYATPRDDQGYLWPAVWNKAWRRSFVGDSKFSTSRGANDLDFHNVVMAKNPRILEWDMPIYYYNYMRPGSITEEDRRAV